MKVGEVYVMYLKIRVQYLIFTSYPLEKKILKVWFMQLYDDFQNNIVFYSIQ